MKTIITALLTVCVTTAAVAPNSGLNLELHANEKVNAASMGLPDLPGARPFKDASSDSAVDMGFSFGSVHFRVLASKYVASASPAQVLDFYRKPLARDGEVLECDHGRAIGSVTITSGGLTCTDSHHHDSHTNVDVGNTHQLRSGTEQKIRVVAIDTLVAGDTRFSLVYIELPRDGDKQ